MVHSSAHPSAPPRRCPASEWLEKKREAEAARFAAPPFALTGEALDLALLISCLPPLYYAWLMEQLLLLAASAPPLHPRRGLADAPRPGFPPPIGHWGRLRWLRARLLAELAFGLSIVATPRRTLNQPMRNRALTERAWIIGRLVEDLGRCPGADSAGQELERALARLRR